MKNALYTFALIAGFSAFAFATNSNNTSSFIPDTYCDGGHECDGNCKKDKHGKCMQASTDGKSADAAKSCCKKGKTSCHGKKASSSEKKDVKPTGSIN